MGDLPKNEVVVGDCLRRVAEEPEDFCNAEDVPLENLIVIGASAGGHNAIKTVLSKLSHDIPAAVIIMQHLPPNNVTRSIPFKMEDWLRPITPVPMQGILSGDRLQQGRIYVTPPGQSVFLEGRTLHLEPQQTDRPAATINSLFESAAQAYHERVIGVILTGLLNDGTAGLRAVHDAGGLTIVQDPVGAEYPDMPANAMQDLPVTFCLSATDIGLTLDVLARRHTTLETGLAVSVRVLKDRVALLVRLLMQSKRSPTTSQFLSTEMRSLEHELDTVKKLLDDAVALASSR